MLQITQTDKPLASGVKDYPLYNITCVKYNQNGLIMLKRKPYELTVRYTNIYSAELKVGKIEVGIRLDK